MTEFGGVDKKRLDYHKWELETEKRFRPWLPDWAMGSITPEEADEWWREMMYDGDPSHSPGMERAVARLQRGPYMASSTDYFETAEQRDEFIRERERVRKRLTTPRKSIPRRFLRFVRLLGRFLRDRASGAYRGR